jgi:hypothetical protein
MERKLIGSIEVFRDQPVRHLIVEPDGETGEVMPVVKYVRPTFLYVCREGREVP